MHCLSNLLIKFRGANRGKPDLASLQLRLVLGTLIIYSIGLGSMSLWTGMEMQQLHTTMQPKTIETSTQPFSQTPKIDFHEPHPEGESGVGGDRKPLEKSMVSLKRIAFLNLVIVAATGSLLIRYFLRPFQRTTQWMVNCTNHLALSPLEVSAPPTEVKQIAQTWCQLFTHLTEAREQQRQFIHEMSHELRTPLSVVYGYLQRILHRDQDLTTTQRETLEFITSETEHTIQVLQNLLDVARANFSSMPLYVESVCLNGLLLDITAMIEKFDHRKIRLKIQKTPITVQADRNCLMQALGHLINYVIRYSLPDEIIAVTLDRKNSQAFIYIDYFQCNDSSPTQPSSLKPPYQGSDSRPNTTDTIELSIAESLINCMGGQITVHAHSHQNSTLTLMIPSEEA